MEELLLFISVVQKYGIRDAGNVKTFFTQCLCWNKSVYTWNWPPRVRRGTWNQNICSVKLMEIGEPKLWPNKFRFESSYSCVKAVNLKMQVHKIQIMLWFTKFDNSFQCWSHPQDLRVPNPVPRYPWTPLWQKFVRISDNIDLVEYFPKTERLKYNSALTFDIGKHYASQKIDSSQRYYNSTAYQWKLSMLKYIYILKLPN